MWNIASDLPIKFAVVQTENVKVKNNQGAFEELLKCAEFFFDSYRWTPISEIPGTQNARQLFRDIGLDPTKRRPSSEALLNRALKNKQLYAVNALVDVGNWCSLDFLLPTCTYDLDKISGNISIRLGTEKEHYLALNDRDINFLNRYVLVDDNGPFGSPMTDSQRTAVSLNTKNACLGIWAPQNYDPDMLKKNADIFSQRCRLYCDGMTDSILIFPS